MILQEKEKVGKGVGVRKAQKKVFPGCKSLIENRCTAAGELNGVKRKHGIIGEHKKQTIKEKQVQAVFQVCLL